VRDAQGSDQCGSTGLRGGAKIGGGLIGDLVQEPFEAGLPNERLIMKNKYLMLVLLLLIPGAVRAQQPAASQAPQAVVTALTSKDLPDFQGKEVLMITVDYPPGSVDPIHRHNAHAFIYVLEGSIIMQVKGSNEVTLTPGQTFYEGPSDVHVVGKNASTTKPAKFVVFFIKDKGAPVLVPAAE
jgi:quercetin dioxygenase-like cupin family protein